MSQRRSYPNSGDFNLDDLFRPEPGQQPAQQGQPQAPYGQPQAHPGQPMPPVGQPSGQPEYLGEGVHAMPTQAIPAQGAPWGPAPQQGAPAPGYGYPQGDPAPETQHLPPYPTGDPNAGAGYPAAQPGYPQPGPAYPPQPDAGYPGYQGHPQAQAQPVLGCDPRVFETTAVPFPERRGSNRPSNKLIIGGVVAGCAVAGILVAVLVGGDDSKGGSDKKTTPVAATSSAAPGPATASGSGAAIDPDVKAQAQPLSDLLGTASDSRNAVVGAVSSVQKCDKLPESQQALTGAAGKRRELQTKLGQLKTDKLPGGQQLVEQLNAAWTASAQADDEYAAWASDSQAPGACGKGDNQHYKNAVTASGQATTAKKQAANLWNAIATQSGLPSRTDGDL
ncbi:hypothetical protein F7Q99_15375 [Streptomyces kaniharaensis]|uniref:Uncharacterized protein n=1 Tax=Streptomyces kaniharaensis TaxID=212423 RepID=A0A6N7KVJ6_9ACTN|nr:hypothetical protein [Streptomyces kaniharaensis]MQS13613.1 hypothetical protein [Streptomyces kaniharaensis]